MKQLSIFLLALTCLASGCLNMDPLLYNPDTELTAYELNDGFRDRWGFIRTPAYTLDDSLIHLFTLPSQIPGDSDTETIYNVYIGDTQGIATDTVIVYCHGNAGSIDDYWDRLVLLANANGKYRYGVLAMDYRGYGLSSGTPSEDGLYADVDASLGWLQEKGLDSERTIIYGFSMGTAPATELSAHPRSLAPSQIILEAPFASAAMMGQSSTHLNLDGTFFTNLNIDNAEEIRQCNQPFLWLHGTADDFIDYEAHGETVWNNYQGPRGRDIRVEGAAHSDIPYVYGLDLYVETVGNFIRGQ